MTIPKRAIELAIEGGWRPFQNGFHHNIVEIRGIKTGFWHFFGKKGDDFRKHMADIALDPSFWQCLGKSLGWDDGEIERRGYADGRYPWMWQSIAHEFYDLILTNGDTDAFWADLLTPNPTTTP